MSDKKSNDLINALIAENEKEEPKKKAMHEKHRQRLKERFLEHGADALEDHEFIELLLFFAIPRKNTNEIAHRLVNEFGKLGNIFEEDVENLCSIKGMTRHAAVMMKVMAACVNKYVNDVNDIANAMLTPHNINTYIKNLFYGHTNEMAYAILLDSKCVVRKVKKLSQGTSNSTPLYPKEVIKLAVNERYPYLMLAHNHPNGNAIPSENDLRLTKTIELALNFVDVRLIDHVIVAGEKVISMSKHMNFMEK